MVATAKAPRNGKPVASKSSKQGACSEIEALRRPHHQSGDGRELADQYSAGRPRPKNHLRQPGELEDAQDD